MNEKILSTEDLERLSREMDIRLIELSVGSESSEMKWFQRNHYPLSIPEKEANIIEEIIPDAGHTSESFWKRFKEATRSDVCEEGGVLYKQWKHFGDLSNKTVLQQFAVILVAMGFSGNALQVLALSCAIIVVHIGVKAYCMEISEKRTTEK
ncbi:MAG: hypothetical protein AB7S75_14490 [Desulfococcaceae bacterium]